VRATIADDLRPIIDDELDGWLTVDDERELLLGGLSEDFSRNLVAMVQEDTERAVAYLDADRSFSVAMGPG
jgi:hypothetical protein